MEYALLGGIAFVAYRLLVKPEQLNQRQAPGVSQLTKSGVDRNKTRRIREEYRRDDMGHLIPPRSAYKTDQAYQAALEDVVMKNDRPVPRFDKGRMTKEWVYDPRKRLHVRAGNLPL
jgi:hypothetical protein